jgi:hypothetical protein
MSISGELRKYAQDFADKAQERLTRIEREIAKIEEKQARLLAQRNEMRSVPERALNFEPTLGPDYQCPRCWVDDETRATLRPVASERPRQDVFRCNRCRFEYIFPF